MTSSCGRYVITFNGEIYNFKELSKELKDKFSIKFKNNTDTIVFLELISKFGLMKALGKLEGMFAFGLWDKKEKKLFLGRDRLGEKPLFFFKNSKYVVFSSEIKALSKFPLIDLTISRKSSYYYSMLGYIPAPYSIFENTFKVLPSQVISFDKTSIKRNIYYKIAKPKINKNITYTKCKKELHSILENSIKKCLLQM